MAKELNRHFSKEDVQVASKHVEGCPTPRGIRETLVKTTVGVRFHFASTGLARITRNKTESTGKDVEKQEPFHVATETVNQSILIETV